MSGKNAGKDHNRASQSLQHGYQEQPQEKATKPLKAGRSRIPRERALARLEESRKALFEKIRLFEQRRRAGS